MGSQLLSEAYPTEPAEGQPSKTGAEIFDEMFPFYLSIGMSPAEYWDGDNDLPRYFRKAYLLKQEQQNQMAWLQGLYIYQALNATLSQAFAGKGKQGTPYLEKPIDFHNKTEDVPRELTPDEEEKQAKLAEVWMNRLCRNYKNAGADTP